MVLEYTAVEPSPNQGWTLSNLEASEREVTLLGRNNKHRNPPWKTETLGSRLYDPEKAT